jgi:hypothetical protein
MFSMKFIYCRYPKINVLISVMLFNSCYSLVAEMSSVVYIRENNSRDVVSILTSAQRNRR